MLDSREVIACSGDGGLMMLLGDLRTAVTYRLPVKVVVFNNGSLGMVKLEQNQGGLPMFGTDLDNPDFAAVAAAMGLDSVVIDDPRRLHDQLPEALARSGPVLIDVRTNPEEGIAAAEGERGRRVGFRDREIEGIHQQPLAGRGRAAHHQGGFGRGDIDLEVALDPGDHAQGRGAPQRLERLAHRGEGGGGVGGE